MTVSGYQLIKNRNASCQEPDNIIQLRGGRQVSRRSERLVALLGDRPENRPRLGGASRALNSVRVLELSFLKLSIIVFCLGVKTVIQSKLKQMNKNIINISFKIILLNIFLAVHSAIAQGLSSDCKAPCSEFFWRNFNTVIKANPVITIMPPVQDSMIFEIANPGIICPDAKPNTPPPEQNYEYGTQLKEHVQYEISVGAQWETFGLTSKVSGQKTFFEKKGAKIKVIGYCRHVSACIAISEKVTTVAVTEKRHIGDDLFSDQILTTYSLFYKSPALVADPYDIDCKTKCDDF